MDLVAVVQVDVVVRIVVIRILIRSALILAGSNPRYAIHQRASIPDVSVNAQKIRMTKAVRRRPPLPPYAVPRIPHRRLFLGPPALTFHPDIVRKQHVLSRHILLPMVSLIPGASEN